MTKLASIKFLVLFLVVTTAYGQKVKYKDIWALLNTKQYDAAEPFLRKYLQENTDNPNAFLYMGTIFQEKSLKEDVLKNTGRAISGMDSAIFYFDKAYKTITEREVKKNSDLYQAYNRRDLRTGEFGVKLSDIQFDLEKRMEGLRERIDRIKMIKHYFSLSDTLYKKSVALFKTIQEGSPGLKEFYLRADENTVKTLTALTVRFDSCLKAFDNYKSSTATLGKTDYNQTMSFREIADFKKDGISPSNYYQDDVQVWDYKNFAVSATMAIGSEIIPMREQLVNYDIEINKLREKLSTESVSVKTDLGKVTDKLLIEKLKKYDSKPLPMLVFAAKVADLEYRSTLLENKALSDSSNMHTQLNNLTKEFSYLDRLDTALVLSAEEIDKKSADYEYFIQNTFNTTAVLKSYMDGLKQYAARERKSKEAELASRKEALRWIISGSDSIPLFLGSADSRYKPLAIVEEKFTVGLVYADSLDPSGYLYTINPSRTQEVKVAFPVEKLSFKESRLSSIKATTLSDAAGQIYFVLVFSDRGDKENKFATTLAKIYRSDGLAWSMNYHLEFVPKDIIFKQDTGELSIRGESNQQYTLDKNGKLVN
jgi:hypothetical protein